jgi:hypothetical protein
MEAGIFSLVHNTHSAAAEFFKDAVVRDSMTDERFGAWHLQHILGCDSRQVTNTTDPTRATRPIATQDTQFTGEFWASQVDSQSRVTNRAQIAVGFRQSPGIHTLRF